MIRQAYAYLASIPSVFIDGIIYVMLAVSGAWGAILTSDSAKLYLGAKLLFWITSGNVTISAALLALKMFRSTSFADHQSSKDLSGPTPAYPLTPTKASVETKQNQDTNEPKQF